MYGENRECENTGARDELKSVEGYNGFRIIQRE